MAAIEDAPAWAVVGAAAVAAVLTLFGGKMGERWLDLVLARWDQQEAEAEEFRRREAEAKTQETWVPQSRAALLSPLRRTVRLMGRDEDLAQLLQWCETRDDRHPGDVRFRLITGPGGVGKSRLAEELKHALDALPTEDGEGWASTTVFHGEGQARHRVTQQRELYPERPLLFVVDYAEARPGLKELIEDAYRATGTVRVLLLARTAGRWWQELESLSGDIGYLLRTGYTNTDLTDPAVAPQELFNAAVEDFARALDIPAPAACVQADDLGGGVRALDVTARALVTVLRPEQPGAEQRDAGQLSLGEVFDELLRHEDTYWAEKARQADLIKELAPQMRKMLVAAAALLGTDDKDQALMVAGRAGKALVDQAEIVLPQEEAAVGWLRAVYPPQPGEGTWAVALQPDRLAEHLIVSILAQPETAYAEQAQAALLDGLTAPAAPHAVTMLVRAATDPAHPARVPSVQELVNRLIQGLPDDWNLMGSLHEALPTSDLRLAPAGLLLTQRRLAHAHSHHLSPADTATAHTQHADFLLWDTLRADDALSHTRRAVALWEELYRQDPDRYGHRYATTLTRTLGTTLATLGRHSEALSPTRRGMELHRDLYRSDPDRYRPAYADALLNLGSCLSALGRYDEALRHERRAVDLREQLYRQDPDRYASDYADALLNLGTSLVRLERPARMQEAPAHIQRGVELYEDLYRQDPVRWGVDYAHALNSLGAALSEQGRAEDALEHERHAAELWKRLHARQPVRYGREYVVALTNLGTSLLRLRRAEEAIVQLQHAVDLYQEIGSDRHQDVYAAALTNLRAGLVMAGRRDTARRVE
ncbi:tetratricopeptide repeat protein [Streptomyces tanashiensis]|uniref:tetratricopeptide repeat protein n=1 Tax=Streptomyces tanashiensis TaxID=67367 RepID=UPI003413124E